TFNLYNNPTGTGPALFTDTETLVGGTATSLTTTVANSGTVYWVATFTDPSGTNPAELSGLADEPVTVVVAPTVSTQQSPTTAVVGFTAISDTPTVSGGLTPYDPNATVTFTLFNNPNGGGAALFADTEILLNRGATSKSFTPTAVGTVYWVATFTD